MVCLQPTTFSQVASDGTDSAKEAWLAVTAGLALPARHFTGHKAAPLMRMWMVCPGDEQAELPPEVVCGLFEALSFEVLLEDAGVAAALEAALARLAPSHELQLAQGGRYPGLYRLLAHPNSAIRSIVGPLTWPIRLHASHGPNVMGGVTSSVLRLDLQICTASPEYPLQAKPFA